MHIINNCLPSEDNRILLIVDESTEWMSDIISESAVRAGKCMNICKIPYGRKHGQEPPEEVVCQMLSSDAIMCVTGYSLAHTNARRQAELRGIPFLSMPDYNSEMLKSPALLVDYKKALDSVEYYASMLTEGSEALVTSEAGTRLSLSLRSREGNCCPGFTDDEHLLGSPPDIEANIAPVETQTQGIIVVDGSITDNRLGVLPVPVFLSVNEGRVTDIQCSDSNIEATVRQIFRDTGDDKAYTVGELGIGFNERAQLCGNMLIDEGAKGFIHFGIGSNWTIGGANRVDFHLDFVLKRATVIIDGKCIIKDGELLYER